MSRLQNMPIKAKVIAAFVLVLVVLGTALVCALVSMRAVATANARILDHLIPAKSAAAQLRLFARRTDDHASNIVMSQSMKEFNDNLPSYKADVKGVSDAAQSARSLSDDDVQRTALDDFDKFWNGPTGYLAQTEHAIELRRAGKIFAAQRAALDASVDEVAKIQMRYSAETDRLVDDASKEALQLQQLAFTLGIGLGLLGAVVSIVAVTATVRSMVSTVRQITASVDSVSVSAREIASGNSDLAQRTEEQAASLEETAASMEQLTATVRQNADNAKQANQLAKGASKVAETGGRVVGDVVATMSAIGESAKRIEDITSVIDGIAFQTNILALNAAVEAARAGEQGRGCAVVASEVRTLAQRSAAAAKEINKLISESVEKAAAGMKLADSAGTTMSEVVSAVQRVTDIMGEISAASVEQGSGIEQVCSAVTQMDQVTQQNAALVEEIAAAASSLDQLSTELVVSMNVFGVTADPGTRPVSAPRPPAAPHPPAPARPRAAAPRRPQAAASAGAGMRRPDAVAIKAGPDGGQGWNSF